MLQLPQSTELNKRIPKQKFYENLSVTPALRRIFVEQVKTICWRNKIAASTMNLALGNHVTELEVFEVKLSSQALDESLLRQIDKEIPYHILFILEYEGKYKAVIGYKEESYSNAAFKVNRYYSTDWMPEEELPLKVEGLSLDAVYENFVRQIAGGSLEPAQPAETLKETVDREARRQKLQKEIEKLERQTRKETQPKIKFELYQKLQEKKRELEALQDG